MSTRTLVPLLALTLAACDCGGAHVAPDAGVDGGGSGCLVFITHAPVDSAAFGDIEIAATLSGAAQATLHVRRQGQADFTALAMSGAQPARATIPQAALTFAPVEYYLEAGNAGCRTTHPAEGAAAPHVIRIVGPARLTLQPEVYEYLPAVHGRQVVFAREGEDGDDDVYLFDLETFAETRLTTNSKAQGAPELWGDVVIWQDSRHSTEAVSNEDIFLMHLSGRDEHQVTTDLLDQYGSRLHDRVVVWRDDRHMTGPINGDIYLYDLGADRRFGTTDDGGEFRVTSDPADQTGPDVHVYPDGRAVVVWYDLRDDADGICDADCDENVYLFDSGPDGRFGTADDSGAQRVTDAPHEQSSPAIGGRWLAWRDARHGDWMHPDLYVYDLGPDQIFGSADDGGERRLDIPSVEPNHLGIDGDRIVYDDYRNQTYDIFLYDLVKGEEQQLTDDPRGQFYPRLHGDVVVWQDARHNDPGGEPFDDIYALVLAE